MIKKFRFKGTARKKVFAYIDYLNKSDFSVSKPVLDIIEDVRKNGDNALRKYALKFDGADIQDIRVPREAFKKAAGAVEKSLWPAIKTAAKNITGFHRMQKNNISGYVFRNTGYKITQKYVPLDSAGIYVPGGQSPLFSTVLMAVIPAIVAGVKKIVIVSPPRSRGEINPYILATAEMLGITEAYRAGGAQAIAALAYGTQSVPAVNKAAGPGNIYSTMAKKHLFGIIGIDSINGPSEITVVADDTADPDFIACDLCAQAEHVNGHSLLVTPSQRLALAVEKAVKKQGKKIKINAAIIVTKNIEEAAEIVNYKAPEHLTAAVKNPGAFIKRITNAPAIFSGNMSPVAFGDYMAGANHILPTNGTARHFSGLSVLDFMKHTHVVEAGRAAMKKFGEQAAKMADAEGLYYHGESIRIRSRKKR
ncbi:MAG TPA: histidinol dehydrogenase [bacterium]|nr:histidinol dehydrogenase [bacterium]